MKENCASRALDLGLTCKRVDITTTPTLTGDVQAEAMQAEAITTVLTAAEISSRITYLFDQLQIS